MKINDVLFGKFSRDCPGADPNSPISIIPRELLDRIFSYLQVPHRLQAISVCKKWRASGVTPTFLDQLSIAYNKKTKLKSIVGDAHGIPSSETLSLTTLPNELWDMIFRFLKIPDLTVMSLVCKRALTISDSLTQKLFKKALKSLVHLNRAGLLPEELHIQKEETSLEGFTLVGEKLDYESMLKKENLSKLPIESLVKLLKNPKASKIPDLVDFVRYYYIHVLKDQQTNRSVSKKESASWNTLAAHLLENGENANIPDSNRRVPLYYAAKSSIETTKAFFCYTTNLNFQDYQGWTPLHVAAYHGKNAAIIFLQNLRQLVIRFHCI